MSEASRSAWEQDSKPKRKLHRLSPESSPDTAPGLDSSKLASSQSRHQAVHLFTANRRHSLFRLRFGLPKDGARHIELDSSWARLLSSGAKTVLWKDSTDVPVLVLTRSHSGLEYFKINDS